MLGSFAFGEMYLGKGETLEVQMTFAWDAAMGSQFSLPQTGSAFSLPKSGDSFTIVSD